MFYIYVLCICGFVWKSIYILQYILYIMTVEGEICKVVELNGLEEERFVRDIIRKAIRERFRDLDIDFESEEYKHYEDIMVEEYEKNVNDALRKGFSRRASKIIGLLTVLRAIDMAYEVHKRDSMIGMM